MAEGRVAVERAIDDFIDDYSENMLVVVLVHFAMPRAELRMWVSGKPKYASASALAIVDMLRTSGGNIPSAGSFGMAVEQSGMPERRRAPRGSDDDDAGEIDMEDEGDTIAAFSGAAAEIFENASGIVDRWLVATEYTEKGKDEAERLVEWSGPSPTLIDPCPIISIIYIFWIEQGGFTRDTLRNQFVLNDVIREALDAMLLETE